MFSGAYVATWFTYILVWTIYKKLLGKEDLVLKVFHGCNSTFSALLLDPLMHFPSKCGNMQVMHMCREINILSRFIAKKHCYNKEKHIFYILT